MPQGADDIEYTVRRSSRARRIRVRVDAHGGVEVVLPARAREREAAAAVAELRPWIERRLREAAAVRERLAARAGTVPWLGETLHVVPQPGRSRAHRRGDKLLVPDGEDAHDALERWYRRGARDVMEPKLHAACARLGRPPAPLTIRGQRTRWGSCSSSGTISLNWRLLLGPEPVLDYVVWHEACHLEVLDHSPRFWRLLERGMPGYRTPKRWLRDHGATLVL